MLPTAEPLTGDPFNVSGYAFNRGMRSIALTLSLRKGEVHSTGLPRHVTLSWRRCVGEWRRSSASSTRKLRQHKPDIITQTLTGHGEGGPLSARPGVNMVNQAESSMICPGRRR